MQLTVPIDVLHLLHHLKEHGFQAYIVGGSVRDLLMGNEKPNDWDFTTNAKPEEIQKLFPESFYENEFGTVAITRKHIAEQFGLPQLTQANMMKRESEVRDQGLGARTIDLESATKIHTSLSEPSLETDAFQDESDVDDLFEITTFRSDGIYTDHRRPEEVTWGKTLEEDLARRDFTINAMAIEINSNVQIPNAKDSSTFAETFNLEPSAYTLIDPYNGVQDLEDKIIRTVGDPHVRFQEDALRMIRAIRLSTQLLFEIESQTLEAISQHASTLVHISAERIRDEFLKMLASDSPVEAILQLEKVNLLQILLPELLEAKNIEQGGHHTTNVWEHSLASLENCPSPDPIVRFATLIHDIAKPRTQGRNGNTITFYNHEIVGARIAKDIAYRFKLSKKDINRMYILVRYHMFYYQPENTDASIRRFMRKVGLENINDIIDLRIGDRLGSGARETSWRLEEMKKRMQEQLNQPFDVNDLAIDGNDLMKEFNLKPGPQIGKILHTLFEEVLEKPELNTREILLEKADKLINRSS